MDKNKYKINLVAVKKTNSSVNYDSLLNSKDYLKNKISNVSAHNNGMSQTAEEETVPYIADTCDPVSESLPKQESTSIASVIYEKKSNLEDIHLQTYKEPKKEIFDFSDDTIISYVRNGASEEEIRADIKKYIQIRNSTYGPHISERNEEELYEGIQKRMKEQIRIDMNPMAYLLRPENTIKMSTKDILDYIKEYRKQYPNDGIFYRSTSGNPLETQTPGYDVQQKTEALKDEEVGWIINNYIVNYKKPIISEDSKNLYEAFNLPENKKIEVRDSYSIDLSKFKDINLLCESDKKQINSCDTEINDAQSNIDLIDKELESINSCCNQLSPDVLATFYEKQYIISYVSPVTGRKYKFNDYKDLINRKEELENAKIPFENKILLMNQAKSRIVNIAILKLCDTDEYKKWEEYSGGDRSIAYGAVFELAFLLPPEEKKVLGYLFDMVSFDAAEEFYKSKENELILKIGYEGATKKLNEWIDKDGKIKDGAEIDAFFDEFIESTRDFCSNVYGMLDKEYTGNIEDMEEKYTKIVLASILVQYYPSLNISRELARVLGGNIIPISVAVFASIVTKNPDIGFYAFSALAAMDQAGEAKKRSLAAGYSLDDSYLNGIISGGTSFATTYIFKKIPFLNPDVESAFKNILSSGWSKGTSSMMDYVIGQEIAGEPLDAKEMFSEGFESACTGFITGIITNCTKIQITKRDGKILKYSLTTIPMEQRSALAQVLGCTLSGQTALTILKKTAPAAWELFKTIVDENPELNIDYTEYDN